MAGTACQVSERIYMEDAWFSETTQSVSLLRSVAKAVTAVRLGMDDSFVLSILDEKEDDWYLEHHEDREFLAETNYGLYLRTLVAEAILYGAAAELQNMVSHGEGVECTPTGQKFQEEDITAVAGIVHTVYEKLENGEMDGTSSKLFEISKRHLCAAYLTAGRDLVRSDLYPAIISMADRKVRGIHVSIRDIRDAIVLTERSEH